MVSFFNFFSSSARSFAKGPIGNLANFALEKFFSRNKQQKPLLSVGQRITDVTIQSACFGRMIPIIYGTVKIAGNIIWATKIKENKHEQTQKIGRLRSITTNYTYSISLAIAICEGEVNEILRIWADDKLIEPRAEKFRFYYGTESQNPDQLIESHEGVGNCPAFRGICYVVIENLSLTDYGNRIPNFVFEVRRTVKVRKTSADLPLEDRIKSIVIIPGSGEFVYDTVVQSKVINNLTGYENNYNLKKTRINQNNRENVADAVLSIKQLKDTCPNIEWVSPVVNWFSDSLDCKSMSIMPGVEYNNSSTYPDEWNVAGFDRSNAHQILKNKYSSPIYGGTPNDSSVIRYLDLLKSNGYKVMFYPMLLVDLYDKPWRGRISGNSKDIKEFFKVYNQFILHYANLVKNKVDAFLIGSEMIGLTKIKDENNNFPAVDALIDLAGKVKKILGNSVKISYAADWSEYHHTDDSWYNLDKLWASEYIDFVGIDAYFPLTNVTENFYDEDEIIRGWQSGEGFDFYYEDSKRNIKKDLSKDYAWKNIEHWWRNFHINPNGLKTAWIPCSKKIWFTEIGFPSVDLATNQPNVFYSPGSSESKFPIHSRGRVDFTAQRQALSATEKVWRNREVVEQLFVWTWDARPFPYWPDLQNIWKDGECWMRGHWVNGKLGLTRLEAIIHDLVIKAGIKIDIIRAEELYDHVDGMVLYNQESIKDIIDMLKKAYFFDTREDSNDVYFTKRTNNRERILVKKRDNIIFDGNKEYCSKQDSTSLVHELKYVNIYFMNKFMDYSTSVEVAMNKLIEDAKDIMSYDFPIVMPPEKAKSISEIVLDENLISKNKYHLTLPSIYLHLKPNDLIEMKDNEVIYNLKISEIKISDNYLVSITATEFDKINYYDSSLQINSKSENILFNKVHFDPGLTDLILLDLPKIEFENSRHLYLGAYNDDPLWRGAILETSDGKRIILENKADIGIITWDNHSELEVQMLNGELLNFDDNDINYFQNFACIGNEIIQFKKVELINESLYRISEVSRQMYDSKPSLASKKFVLINNNLYKFRINEALIGLTMKFRISTIGSNPKEYNEVKYKLN